MAMGPMSVEFASVTRVDWVHDANARWRNIVRLTTPTVSQNQAAHYAMEEEHAYVDSVPVTQVGLVRSGESTVNVTISTVCGSKESFAQIVENVAVDSASVTLAGRETTVTAPPAKTPACPVGECAVDEVTANAGFVSVLNLAPMETPVRSAPPVLIPAL